MTELEIRVFGDDEVAADADTCDIRTHMLSFHDCDFTSGVRSDSTLCWAALKHLLRLRCWSSILPDGRN